MGLIATLLLSLASCQLFSKGTAALRGALPICVWPAIQNSFVEVTLQSCVLPDCKIECVSRAHVKFAYRTVRHTETPRWWIIIRLDSATGA